MATVAAVVPAFAVAQPASDPKKIFQKPQTRELAEAIGAGNAAKVRQIVQAGADLSDKGEGDITLLQWALIRDQPAMVTLLLDLGADVAQRGYRGQTVLHLALLPSRRRYLQILLDHGIDPNLRGGSKDSPVLSEALMAGDRGAVALLLAHRADPNITDRQGDTALHIAAQINDYRSMLALLEAGADPTRRNKAGQTFAPYFAIHPKESMMSNEARSSREAVRQWLAKHGFVEGGK